MYQTDDYFFDLGTPKKHGSSGFTTGDSMTIVVDLDANTIGFKKNGAAFGWTASIKRQAYNFMFNSYRAGDQATIMAMN